MTMFRITARHPNMPHTTVEFFSTETKAAEEAALFHGCRVDVHAIFCFGTPNETAIHFRTISNKT